VPTPLVYEHETIEEISPGSSDGALPGLGKEEAFIMFMSEHASATIGWVSIAAGIAGLLGFAFIILFFTVGQPFGTLNDVSIAVTAILSLALALMLYPSLHAYSPLLSLAALVLVPVGAVLVVVGSALSILGIRGWYLSGLYMAAGNAMVGLWLVALSYAALRSDFLPRGLAVLGVVAGVVLALGLVAIPGIFRDIDTKEYEPTVINLLWWTSSIGYLAAYPVWCILQGRILATR
jgi:hypothetical protein